MGEMHLDRGDQFGDAREAGRVGSPPPSVEGGMVVFGIVSDDGHAPTKPGADAPDAAKEFPTDLGIETSFGRGYAQFPSRRRTAPK